MHRYLLSRPLLRPLATSYLSPCQFGTLSTRWKEHELKPRKADYTNKYSHKLQQAAEKQGITVEDLIVQTREKEQREKKERLTRTEQLDKVSTTSRRGYASADLPSDPDPIPGEFVRKDSSPVKPLNSILNLKKLLESPHTPGQVSRLWTAYHASRSGGTGRGYLCAAIPVDSYNKMVSCATKYKTFLLPVPRDDAQIDYLDRGDTQPVEFFFLQWDFHGSPPDPLSNSELFASQQPSSNPQISTILFTPLLEYKTRSTFATPHLVITHYTDLVETHGLVLLRGEITPVSGRTSGKEAQFLLSQQDAQLLALGVQKFYLWDGDQEREALLRSFHEDRDQFRWEDLLKLSEVST